MKWIKSCCLLWNLIIFLWCNILHHKIYDVTISWRNYNYRLVTSSCLFVENKLFWTQHGEVFSFHRLLLRFTILLFLFLFKSCHRFFINFSIVLKLSIGMKLSVGKLSINYVVSVTMKYYILKSLSPSTFPFTLIILIKILHVHLSFNKGFKEKICH